MGNLDFQDSVDTTRLLINGRTVNPWQLQINPEPFSGPTLEAVIEIGNILLCHELTAAHVEVNKSGILDFVREDITDNPRVALEAYLGIVRHSRYPVQRGIFVRLFGGKQSQPEVIWEWKSVRAVEAGDNTIKILGEVARLDDTNS